MIWILSGFLLAIAALVGFIMIARKGRRLRTQQPLPPPADTAYLQWHDGNRTRQKEVVCPFYFGNSPDSDLLLKETARRYEVCLFHHHQRFAFQSLEEAIVLVNGEEILAGYLRDGDHLLVAGIEFVFRCK